MTSRASKADPDAPVLVMDIGNNSVSMAAWDHKELNTPVSAPTGDPSAFDEAFEAHLEAVPRGGPAAVVIASVVPLALERIRACVLARLNKEALVIGETVHLPSEVTVDDPRTIGVDRVCAAAAAYDALRAACAVVDFGTAVTVDLVDDEGTLLGGAILPGLKMQFRSLHEYTAALPEVDPGMPERPYGRNTVEAVQAGVCRGLASAVRGLVEGYAASLNRWPHVIATGGDMKFLSPYCDYVDTVVPDLTLRGVGLAYSEHLETLGA